MVCSPAGTTIEAVYALEKGGFNALIMDAIKKCEEKSKLLSLEE
jgi:pyrroline-5-carboxylate reductase